MSFQISGQAPWRNNNLTFLNKDHPVSEQGETIIGFYLLALGCISWIGNSIVIFVLYKQRAVLQPTDYLTFNLAISDGSIAIFGYSRGIIDIFNVFRDDGFLVTSIWTCQIDGFLTLLFGLASINTLTVISVTRYIKGCHPNRVYCISPSSVSFAIFLIWTAAFFWSLAPLLGWGSYTDRMYGTCEIDWTKASFSTTYKSYIISVFICCFFVPVIVMVFSYTSIINTVKSSHALSGMGDPTDRQRRMEQSVTRISLVVCTCFIAAWSPYAVISMWSACGYTVPNLTNIFASLFAKSASFYNPIIYFGMSSKFRKDISIFFHFAKEIKDPVKLKQFKILKQKMDNSPSCGEEKKAINAQPALHSDSEKGSHSNTPPPVNRAEGLFAFDNLPSNPDIECDRL
ncbi:visual pigment-like receptor peropsin [Notechis scutatus]|uniref:Visual pigment-like receptor peropsin n=1 Tax=Notechis scutatus TaxID=8663 RepID=A0A6J1U2E4_9SAUR|nr:visual pigment-like receptor peropsin [Notechis scutatus]